MIRFLRRLLVLLGVCGTPTPNIPRSVASTFVFGATRVGKTSAYGRWFNLLGLAPPTRRRRPKAGMLGLTVKVSEGENLARTALMVRPPGDVVHVKPGSNHTCDILAAYCGLKGASAAECANMFGSLAELAARYNKRPEESFWAFGRQRVLYFVLVLLIAVFTRPSTSQLYRFLVELPTSVKDFEKKDDGTSKYSESFCGQVARAALQAALGDGFPPEKRNEVTNALLWLSGEWATIPEKTRESYRQTCLNVVFPFTQEPVASLCAGNTFGPELIDRDGKVLILDVPVIRYGLPALLYQGAFRYICDLYMLDRTRNARVVYKYVDEYQYLAMPEWDGKVATVCAESNYFHCYMTQSVSTVLESLGGTPLAREQLNSILGNSVCKAFFWTDDEATQKLMAHLSGQHKELMMSGGGGDAGSYDPFLDATGRHRPTAHVHFSESWAPVFRPEWAMGLLRGGRPHFACEALLVVAGEPPRVERIPQILLPEV